MRAQHRLRKFRRAWALIGTTALVAFIAWCALAYRANGEAQRAAASDAQVAVSHGEGFWMFMPQRKQAGQSPGLLFFAGSLVDPRAYAPIARQVARQGFPVLVVELPRRGAFGGADGADVLQRAQAAMDQLPGVRHWLAAGHSRGGEVAARFAASHRAALIGLVLIGTSHPRDFSLRDDSLPVLKIIGTRDGLASPERNWRTRHNLPPTARWLILQGGNHSQFGDYGFQPGDRFAELPRQRQRAATVAALLAMLRADPVPASIAVSDAEAPE